MGQELKVFDDDRTRVTDNASSQRDDGPSNARIFTGSILFAVAVVTASILLAWILYDWMSRLF